MIMNRKKIYISLVIFTALSFGFGNLYSQNTIQMNKASFLEKVVNYEVNPSEWIYLGDKPAIIDFYADWCRPCKIIAPHLEELAKDYKGEIYIYKINVDKEKELASAFGIQSIPTLLFVPKQGNPQLHKGILGKDELKLVIDDVLLNKNPKKIEKAEKN